MLCCSDYISSYLHSVISCLQIGSSGGVTGQAGSKLRFISIYIYFFFDCLMIGVLITFMKLWSHKWFEFGLFNNSGNHPRMCMLSTLYGNIDKHSPFDIYMYIYIITLIKHIHINSFMCNSEKTKMTYWYIVTFINIEEKKGTRILMWAMPDHLLVMRHKETRYHQAWSWFIFHRVYGARHKQINKLKNRNPKYTTVNWIIIGVSNWFPLSHCLAFIWNNADLFSM